MDGKRALEYGEQSLDTLSSKRVTAYRTHPNGTVNQQVRHNGSRNWPSSADSSWSHARSPSVTTVPFASPTTMPVTAPTPQISLHTPDPYPSQFAFPLARSIFGYDEATIEVLASLQDGLLNVGFHKQDMNENERMIWRQVQGFVLTKNFAALDYLRMLWTDIANPDESPITAGIRNPVFVVLKRHLIWRSWLVAEQHTKFTGQRKFAQPGVWNRIAQAQTQAASLGQSPDKSTSNLAPASSIASRQTGQLEPIRQRQEITSPGIQTEDFVQRNLQRDATLLGSQVIALGVTENANNAEDAPAATPPLEQRKRMSNARLRAAEQKRRVQDKVYANSRGDVLASQLPNRQQEQEQQRLQQQLLPQVGAGIGFSQRAISIPDPVAPLNPTNSLASSQATTIQTSTAQTATIHQLQQDHPYLSNVISPTVRPSVQTQSMRLPSSQSSYKIKAAHPLREKYYIYPAVKYVAPSPLSPQNLQTAMRFTLSPQQYANCLKSAEYVYGRIMINLRGYLGDNDQTVSWTDMGVTLNDKSFVVKHGNDKPVNLSSLVQPGYNMLKILMAKWPDRFQNNSYTVAVELCPILSPEEVIEMAKSHHIEIDDAKDQILKTIRPQETDRNGDDGDDIQCLTSSYKLTLKCPLSMKRMKLPVRSVRCKHATCFDLYNFLEISRASWKCPICLGISTPPLLAVDNFVKWMIENTGENVKSVTIYPDEQWQPDIISEGPEQADILDDE
ncbi:hypothetical protein V1517DRAFT_311618 [Lipomyces orientalis]|uniref:Uncharacterized protein n=1 Tax=Lipomyces orientalis TaxID=1233043 RepID=A0ACC3TYX2_9ASCO